MDKVDLIVVLDKGCISECGTFTELLNSEGPFKEFLHEHLKKKAERNKYDSESDGDTDGEADREVRRKYMYHDDVMKWKHYTLRIFPPAIDIIPTCWL